MEADVTFSLMGGLDRSVRSNAADPSTFYNLHNLRHNIGTRGLLEQTPYFRLYFQSTRFTYYDGGALTEPAASKVNYINSPVFVTDYTINGVNTQMQVYYQTTVPAGESIHTGCRLVINNIAGLGITLGSTLDVEMTAPAVFRWRKNGGGYTAGLVPTTQGIDIDGGNATLYFLANSGFAGTETWSWSRFDRSYSDSTYLDTSHQITGVVYKDNLYFTTKDGRVMMQTATPTFVSYVISVGYRPVYGRRLIIFDDHLIVGSFAKAAGYYTGQPRQFTVGWSDKTDLHDFIPTDLNEADSETLSFNEFRESTNAYFGILGFAVLKQQLFVFTNIGLYSTPSLGLPIVFSLQITEFPAMHRGSGTSVCPSPTGVYLLGECGIFFFDGASVKDIGGALYSYAREQSVLYYNCITTYNILREELICYDPVTKNLLCYQERYGVWYTRSASFALAVTSLAINQFDVVYLGQESRTSLLNDTTWQQQPVMDASAGASYATPKVTSQLVGHSLQYVREIVSTYLGFYSVISTVNVTYYSTSTNLEAKLYWYANANPSPTLMTSPATDTAAILLADAADGTISYPRISARVFAIEVQLVGLVANKPPGQGGICGLELHLVDTTPKAVV